MKNKKPFVPGEMYITPDDKKHIEEKGIRVAPLKHCYRLNGTVDLWYDGRTIEIPKTQKQYHFKSKNKQLQKAVKLAKTLPIEKFDFAASRKNKNGISYKEWKNNKNHKEEKSWVAEYYHWNNNKDKTSNDHLYFLRSGVNLKIGRSKNPSKRIKDLSTGLADKWELLYVEENKGFMESKLHSIFEEDKTSGAKEWFYESRRILKFIDWLKENKQGNPKAKK